MNVVTGHSDQTFKNSRCCLDTLWGQRGDNFDRGIGRLPLRNGAVTKVTIRDNPRELTVGCQQQTGHIVGLHL